MLYLFFLFFTCPILSPFVGKSLYLNLIIPFIDLKFLKNYLLNFKFRKLYLIIFLLLCFWSMQNIVYFFKIFTALITLLYLSYAYKANRLYILHYMMSFNVLIAIIQFSCKLIWGVEVLSPDNIGSLLFGKYAMQTGDPFSPGSLILPFRVSGLSKEPGFFSSLLFASFFLFLCEKKKSIKESKKQFYIILSLYLIGLMVSFSKVTMAFAIGTCIYVLIRPFITRFRPSLFVIGFLLVMIAGTQYYYANNTSIRNSVIHRTIGYKIMMNLYQINTIDLMFGLGQYGILKYADDIPIIKESPFYEKNKGNILDNSGLATIFLENGVIYFILLLLFIEVAIIPTTALFFLFLGTINVSLLTTSSFVLLWYFNVYVLKITNVRKKISVQ